MLFVGAVAVTLKIIFCICFIEQLMEAVKSLNSVRTLRCMHINVFDFILQKCRLFEVDSLNSH